MPSGEKEKKLEEIIKELNSILIAYSGGVDSTYLLYKAREVLGRDNVVAVTAVSETFQTSELEEASQLAQKIDAVHCQITTNEFASPEFTRNPPERCYYCKTELFSKLKTLAYKYGVKNICDGTNYEDGDDFRPGLKAAEEMGVRSPLKEAKLNKDDIRTLSREAGLETWNHPSAACLASRIPYGETITREKLNMIAAAEGFLSSLGFRNFRVRCHDSLARIEVMPTAINHITTKKEDITQEFKKLGFTYITVDLQGFRSGSMNENLKQNEG